MRGQIWEQISNIVNYQVINTIRNPIEEQILIEQIWGIT